MTNPLISIVIPAFNEERYISECLDSIKSQCARNLHYEVIVVDNGSTDSTYDIALEKADKAYLLPEGNVGAVRNFGVKCASGELLAFIDSDCKINSSWLSTGISILKESELNVVGGTLVYSLNPTWVEEYWLLKSKRAESHEKKLMGSCIFIRKEKFIEAGGFNEEFTTGEDSDLSDRLSQDGCKIIISPELQIEHMGNPKTALDFINRQIWHASDYAYKLDQIAKDKVMAITCLYIIASVSVVFSMFVSALPIAAALLFHQSLPVTLSIKRVVRSNYKVSSLKEVFLIIVIDNMYLIGRSMGLVASVVRRIKSRW